MKVHLKPSQTAIIRYLLKKHLDDLLVTKQEQEKLNIKSEYIENDINQIKEILDKLDFKESE